MDEDFDVEEEYDNAGVEVLSEDDDTIPVPSKWDTIWHCRLVLINTGRGTRYLISSLLFLFERQKGTWTALVYLYYELASSLNLVKIWLTCDIYLFWGWLNWLSPTRHVRRSGLSAKFVSMSYLLAVLIRNFVCTDKGNGNRRFRGSQSTGFEVLISATNQYLEIPKRLTIIEQLNFSQPSRRIVLS